jgi:hypothetical protein
MPEPQQPKRDVLGYASARPEADLTKLADPVEVLSLCLPALICWIVFLGTLWLPFPFLKSELALRVMLIVWFVGIITAIASFANYAGRNKGPRPWYVWVNLTLNGAGLIFTTGVVILIFMK